MQIDTFIQRATRHAPPGWVEQAEARVDRGGTLAAMMADVVELAPSPAMWSEAVGFMVAATVGHSPAMAVLSGLLTSPMRFESERWEAIARGIRSCDRLPVEPERAAAHVAQAALKAIQPLPDRLAVMTPAVPAFGRLWYESVQGWARARVGQALLESTGDPPLYRMVRAARKVLSECEPDIVLEGLEKAIDTALVRDLVAVARQGAVTRESVDALLVRLLAMDDVIAMTRTTPTEPPALTEDGGILIGGVRLDRRS